MGGRGALGGVAQAEAEARLYKGELLVCLDEELGCALGAVVGGRNRQTR